MIKKVVITGGTGLVGKALTNLLLSNGYEVFVLTRNQKQATQKNNFSFWDVKNEIIDEQIIKTADYIVHLAGDGIADKRWTSSRKISILESRTKPLELIFKVLKNNSNQLKALISASGVGYYGAITSDKVFTEEDLPATDFLGKTCVAWEKEVDKFNELGIRTVKLRTGIVLAKEGGALSKMTLPFKYSFGSVLGSGKQYMPWVSLSDLCQAYLFAIENNQLFGAYNTAVEDETNNASFSKSVARVLNKRIFLPNVPAFVLKILLGEMAGIILNGSRVSNSKIKAEGFHFLHEDLDKCLEQELVE